ncbi:HEAT repeat domain-containing protein [Lentisphaera marina]|uniref:DUF7133 domain-containing protein n=1 Tax=Lentisphaera marina TaxID=1111041 RepID=UPI002366CD98|nr:HEAT repeat domain-containing protein [Lentisphaera marina]MDD7984074.1 HEAT repeat domain-containing protein [Lentisphaera marina]
MIKAFALVVFGSITALSPLYANPQVQDFTGKIHNPKFSNSGKIAQYPSIEYMTSFGIGHDGSLYIVESPRQKHGQILDIRGAKQFTQQDFKNQTVEERIKMQEQDPKTGKAYFTRNSERIAKITDSNGDGVFDTRKLFADGMMGNTADGVAFTAIEHDKSIYLTCIPNLWKFTDTNGDGIADKSEILLTGFGPRLSMMGHDMHGVIMGPDGRLYWSIGDRGYNVTSKEGVNFAAPGRGAIFRCNTDGTQLEVFHYGLRNPQEIAFDEHGNLFTFDNTGDIGDSARAVYAVESGDSGWYMEHQGLHQYRARLDHAEFNGRSPWIEDQMFKPQQAKQPLWYLPPISNFSSGPSGITYLTGEAIPEEWRNSFLVSNFRASTSRSNILRFQFAENGASFKTLSSDPAVSQVVASDVNLGFNGKIYIADFGGGWSVNDRGSIQYIEHPEGSSKASVKQTQQLFAEGFDKVDKPEKLLNHPDMRVRKYAQFELVKRKNVSTLENALAKGTSTVERLHALWGLSQLQRNQIANTAKFISSFANDSDYIIRQHVCRSLGDFKPSSENENILINALQDKSPRVQLTAIIALGKVGSSQAINALWKCLEMNNGKEHIIRHVGVRALARLNDEAGAIKQVKSEKNELRLIAVLILRELESTHLQSFVQDKNQLVKEEAIRAIYDKQIMAAMPSIAAESSQISNYSLPLQRRILLSNMWIGEKQNAVNTINIANNTHAEKQVREFALRSLKRWSKPPENDPVFSTYRPTKNRVIDINSAISPGLTQLLESANGHLLEMGLKLAEDIKLPLSSKTLLAQIKNSKAPANIRISSLNTLIAQDSNYLKEIPAMILSEKDDLVQARLIELTYEYKLANYAQLESKYLNLKQVPQARAIIKGLKGNTGLQIRLIKLWNQKDALIPKEAQLELYLALKSLNTPKASSIIAQFDSKPDNSYQFTTTGGDIEAGKIIFEGQGACLQCHQIDRKGGVQGPALDGIGTRQNPHTIMESLIHPNKLIAPGFGTFIVSTKDGKSTAGILQKETVDHYEIKTATKTVKILKTNVVSKQGPSSGMPPIARALQLHDLRDLIAYLESLKDKKARKKSGH